MNPELVRANAILAANRRLRSAVSAMLGAQSAEELDRKIVDVLPGAVGFERVAVLTVPAPHRPAQIAHALGYPHLDLTAIPKHSPLAAGGDLDGLRSGSDEDGDPPHGDVRGSYLLAPLCERGRTVALVYADSLRDEDDLPDALSNVGYALEVAGLVRSTLTLAAERERLLAEMDALARTDALTGLPNRRVFEERLEEELHRSARSRRPFALSIFDLDHFKEINDSYGHQAGDEALQHFAATIRSRARHVDFFARFAGDEFAMVLVDVDHQSARAIVDRMLDAVRQSRLSSPISLSASAGVALSYPVDTAETLIERADAALYEAKKRGRDRLKVT